MQDKEEGGLDSHETEFGGEILSRRKKVIHFSSGETLEEEEEEESTSEEGFSEPAERARNTWKNVGILVLRMSLQACDFLGERMAGLLGLEAAKYQYAIDQYHSDHKRTIDVREGVGERICLSNRLDSTYGATHSKKTAAAPPAKYDLSQGSHNIGYQEE